MPDLRLVKQISVLKSAKPQSIRGMHYTNVNSLFYCRNSYRLLKFTYHWNTWNGTKNYNKNAKKTTFRVSTLQTMWNSLTIPWQFATLLPMLSVTHIMPVLVLLSVAGVGMQQCMIQNQNEMHKLSKVKNECKYMQLTINSFRPLSPDKIFSPDTSLTAVKWPEISRFSRQVVTLV